MIETAAAMTPAAGDPASSWRHVLIEFTDPATAEHVAATTLAPALVLADELRSWWFLRKSPAWRLRYRPAHSDSVVVDALLDEMSGRGQITRWTSGIYEPETLAFGGPAALDVAHTLFHHDSHHLLARATAQGPGLGRCETTVLLFSALLRAAGLDWFEQGDVWNRVAALRATVGRPGAEPGGRLGDTMRRLMTAVPPDPPLPRPWSAAFDTAGHRLGDLARAGHLRRGLRAVLAHHFIFHANRAGLSAADQATLGALAVHTVFHATPTRPAAPDTVKVPAMTNTAPQPTSNVATADPSSSDVVEVRAALATRLVTNGIVRSDAVEAAFREVPRHLFLPGLPLTDAYADAPVYTKHDGAGTRISAASQPRIVAMMLEQLGIRPGQRVLELGTGTGYNAALIAAAVGPTGHVTTIDIDDDLVTGARAHLAAAGVDNVEVLCADGALGHPDAAPYDRVIATVGAFEIPRAWLAQLGTGGRLLAPVRLAGAASRSIAFERDDHGWTGRGSEMAVFMPLRGIGDDARRVLDLTGTGEVTLQTHHDNTHATDPATLTGVLDTPGRAVWTGVHFASAESFEWLDLWLSCHLPNPLMRMEVAATARDRGLVRPMFPAAAMATSTADGDLAYLTIRPAEPAPDRARRFEVGVIGHGTRGADLAEQVGTAISTWNGDARHRTVHFAIPDTAPLPATGGDRVVLDRPDSPMTLSWQ